MESETPQSSSEPEVSERASEPGGQPSASVGSATDQQPTRLTIRGPGLAFDREIPDALVLRVMRLVLTGDDEPSITPATSAGGGGSSGGRKQALVEYYRHVGPKKYPEKLVTIGAYLQEVMGRTSVTPDELKAQFRAVAETAPANLPRDLRIAVGEGWIAEEHDLPGSYFVTRSGLDALERGFSTDGGRKSRRRRRAASKSGAAQPSETDE
jgi:hypothetical protein